MLKPSITVERFPYDDNCLHVQFEATNGLMSGKLDYYCAPDDLQKIGNGLVNFPQKIGDEYKYELGSSKRERQLGLSFYAKGLHD